MQLLERRFTKTAAYNKSKKKGPGVICTADTTNEQIMMSYMNHMRMPLRWQQSDWWRVGANLVIRACGDRGSASQLPVGGRCKGLAVLSCLCREQQGGCLGGISSYGAKIKL